MGGVPDKTQNDVAADGERLLGPTRSVIRQAGVSLGAD
jgi:hypothetical protein